VVILWALIFFRQGLQMIAASTWSEARFVSRVDGWMLVVLPSIEVITNYIINFEQIYIG
jgi:hypothetical protein